MMTFPKCLGTSGPRILVPDCKSKLCCKNIRSPHQSLMLHLRHWEEQKKQFGIHASLPRALFKLLMPQLFFSWTMSLIYMCILKLAIMKESFLAISNSCNFYSVLQVYLLRWFIASFGQEASGQSFDLYHTLSAGFAYLLADIVQVTIIQGSMHWALEIGLKFAVAISYLVYNKESHTNKNDYRYKLWPLMQEIFQILQVPTDFLNHPSLASKKPVVSTGHIVNLLSNDVEKVKRCVMLTSALLTSPLQCLVLSVGAWQHMGPATVGGITFIILTSTLSGADLKCQ